MDEILALQAELARVQEAPTAFKLSEPNIVEIVSTLSQLRLVDVLFTTNGKEYLTPEQLLREVGDEILSHGGRVNVADLPALLNVDLPHIERAVTQLLATGRDGLQRVGGEVLTEYYLDSLAEEIDTALRGVGRLTLAEIAVAHALSTDFVTSVVESRIGALIHAKLSGGSLFTASYVARHLARVRGVLSALHGPASLPALLKAHGFNEALFYEAVGSLHAAGRLAGTLQAKTSFTPAVHRLAQAAAVGARYEQNGVVEYAALARMGVRDPRAHLAAEHPGGVELDSCYMSPGLVSTAEAGVEEALSGAGAADLRSAFDCDLTDADLAAFAAASAPLSAAVAAKRYLPLTASLLVAAPLAAELKERAEALAAEVAKVEHAATAARSKGGGESGGEGGGKRGAKGGKKGGGGGGGGGGGPAAARRRTGEPPVAAVWDPLGGLCWGSESDAERESEGNAGE